ncbi:DUF2913 family protein [Escherichia coli]|uniref:hypothetical protein n=1 Tax=Escherichia coli TaxID=562 RepID=UPI0018C364A9|nr:hypothetical protein [Escherichia coli]MBG0912487.1 DUF2913 family protein [Escherichia coli]
MSDNIASGQLVSGKAAHLAWCGLVVLHLARRDGRIASKIQENLFLNRWRSTALKQHRFPRTYQSPAE